MSHHFDIQIVSDATSLEATRTLLRAYNEHLYTFIDPALLQHREQELTLLPAGFLPPDGAFLLVSEGGQALGCVGLRPIPLQHGARTAEICRLWVSPAARGQSLGKLLLEHAIARARHARYQAIVLNTIRGSMNAAQSLYDRAGFQQIPAYKHVTIPGVTFYRLTLTEDSTQNHTQSG